jgi:hypothetical protein
MKYFAALLVACCLTITLQAQQLDVEKVVDMVRSSIALQQDDKKVADYLKKVKLTQRLTEKNVEDLIAQGAGPRTAAALRVLCKESANLPAPSTDATYSPATAPQPVIGAATASIGPKRTFPPPDSVKQSAILDQIRQYAENYTQNLPNFLCTRVDRRYVDPNYIPKNGDNWHIIDTLTAKVSYSDGRENTQVVLINNRPIVGNFDPLKVGGGTVSTGEFGTMMAEVFDQKSQAQFNWDHWGNLDGRLMAVYNYFIDSGHSNYSIDYMGEQKIITAYRGLVYADPDTGVVYRIKFEAVDIPSSFPVQAANEILDYDQVEINNNKYICPLRAQLFLRSGRQRTKNDIEFRLYRKFGTESSITYDTPDALPDNREKPLTSPPPTTEDPDVPLPAGSAPPPPPHN